MEKQNTVTDSCYVKPKFYYNVYVLNTLRQCVKSVYHHML